MSKKSATVVTRAPDAGYNASSDQQKLQLAARKIAEVTKDNANAKTTKETNE